MQNQNMVKHLQELFLEKCRKNENYSLRAFARSLSIPPSSLSEIINEKRALTEKLKKKIGLALNMTPAQINSYHGKRHGNTSKDKVDDVDYKQLSLDSFCIISDWYHYAILQLIKTRDFTNEPAWIASRLGLKVTQVKLALARLKRVGIIESDNQNNLKDLTEGSTTHLKINFTNDELRSFQIKALEKAIDSLKRVPINYRDNTSMTMAINKSTLPEIKDEIKKFRRQLTKKFESYENPDEVYQLAISMTPLTEITKKERGNS
ncbi:MAG: DUF4423 domain-containing protein [Bdellovibrionota bacterium]